MELIRIMTQIFSINLIIRFFPSLIFFFMYYILKLLLYYKWYRSFSKLKYLFKSIYMPKFKCYMLGTFVKKKFFWLILSHPKFCLILFWYRYIYRFVWLQQVFVGNLLWLRREQYGVMTSLYFFKHTIFIPLQWSVDNPH